MSRRLVKGKEFNAAEWADKVIKDSKNAENFGTEDSLKQTAVAFKQAILATKNSAKLNSLVKFPITEAGYPFKYTVGEVISISDNFIVIRSLIGEWSEAFLWCDVIKYPSCFKPLDKEEVKSILQENYADSWSKEKIKDAV